VRLGHADPDRACAPYVPRLPAEQLIG
jgi:hypothetical protein